MKTTDSPHHPTEAQINANRENAKKSTGPRTPAGKAASSRNGITHGLSAEKHLVPGEDPEEFLALLEDLFDTFHPVGQSQEKLVLRIAADQYRLDRVFPMEGGIYRERILQVAEADDERQRRYVELKDILKAQRNPPPFAPAPRDPGDLLARAFDIDCAGPNALAKLTRYESALERSIDRSLRQLKALQEARRNPPAPPKQDDEANPNSAPDSSDHSPQTPHSTDVGRASRPAGGLQTPLPFDNPSPPYLE
jgi:hypothetical protein